MEKAISFSPQQSASIYKDGLNRMKVVPCSNKSISPPIITPYTQPLVVHPLPPPMLSRTSLLRSTFGINSESFKVKRGRGSLSRKNGLRIHARATKRHPGFGGSNSKRQKGGKSTSDSADFRLAFPGDLMCRKLLLLVWLFPTQPPNLNVFYQIWLSLPHWKELGWNNPTTLEEAFKLLGWPLTFKEALAKRLAVDIHYENCRHDPRFSRLQFLILSAVEDAVEFTPIGEDFETRLFDKLKEFSFMWPPSLSRCPDFLTLVNSLTFISKAQFYCFYAEFRIAASAGLETQLGKAKFSDRNEAFEFALQASVIQGIEPSVDNALVEKALRTYNEPTEGLFSSLIQVLKSGLKPYANLADVTDVAKFEETEKKLATMREEFGASDSMEGAVELKFRDGSSVWCRRKSPFILEFLEGNSAEATSFYSWNLWFTTFDYPEEKLRDNIRFLSSFSQFTLTFGFPKESMRDSVHELKIFNLLELSIWRTPKAAPPPGEESLIEMIENIDMEMYTENASSKKLLEDGSVIDKQSESSRNDESDATTMTKLAIEDIQDDKDVDISTSKNARSREVQPVQKEVLVNSSIDREERIEKLSEERIEKLSEERVEKLSEERIEKLSEERIEKLSVERMEKLRGETDEKGREERGAGSEGQGFSGESFNGAQVVKLPSSHALLNEETSQQNNSKPIESVVQNVSAEEFVSPGNGDLMQDVTPGLEKNVPVSRELDSKRDDKDEEGKEEEEEVGNSPSNFQSDLVIAEVKVPSSTVSAEVSSQVLSTEANSVDEDVLIEVDEVSYATQMWLHAEHAYLRLRQCVGRSWEGWVRAVAYAGAYTGVQERVIHFLMSSEDDGFLLERGVIIKVMESCQLARKDLYARYEAMCGERAFVLPEKKILDLSNLACEGIPPMEALQSELSLLRRDLEASQHIDSYFSRVLVNGNIPLPPVSPVSAGGKGHVHDISENTSCGSSSDGSSGSADSKTDSNGVTEKEKTAQLSGNFVKTESTQDPIVQECPGIQENLKIQTESTTTNGSKTEKIACPKCKQKRWSSIGSHLFKMHVSRCRAPLDSPTPVNNDSVPSSNMPETNSATVTEGEGGGTTQFVDSTRSSSSGNQSEDEAILGGRNMRKRRGTEERQKKGKTLIQEPERMSGKNLARADERRRSSRAMAGGAEPSELVGVRRPEWQKIDTEPFFYIVDTNVLMDPNERDHLEYVATPRDGSTGRAKIVVPCTVGRELENICRNPTKQKEDRGQAAKAFKWYNQHLRKKAKWLHAVAKEEMVLPFPSTAFSHKDDEILGVLAYFHNCHPGRAFLLTHDKPMQNKALHNCALPWLLPLVIQDDGLPPPRYLKLARQAAKQDLPP